jgi:acetyltransferase-like isoleucine patch superfamily enzyme
MIFKLFWLIRALVYKPFFGRFGFPSYIGEPIFISRPSRIYIGRKVRIFPGVRLEVVNSNSLISIGDDVAIGQNVHMTSGGQLIIGDRTTFTENIMITNIDHDYEEIGIHVLRQKHLIKETIVGENCFIGFGAVIQAGTILGKQCVVGANSVVRGIFPDYSVIVGSPAKIIKRYDVDSRTWRKTNPDGTFSD